jgi:hypothetical protein
MGKYANKKCLNITGILCENLPQLDFRELPHHPIETNTATNLNGPTSKNSVDLNHVSVEATSMYPLARETFNSVTCGQQD